MTFYNEARRLEWLPEWVDKIRARQDLLQHQRERVPLLDRVLKGETTFEAAVRPLVEENLKVDEDSYKRGVCNSDEFDRLAAAAILDLAEALDPGILVRRNSRKSDVQELFGVSIASVAFPVLAWFVMGFMQPVGLGFLALLVGSCVAAGAVVGGALWLQWPTHVAWRRGEAERILNQAKFLDRIASGEHQREGGDSQ